MSTANKRSGFERRGCMCVGAIEGREVWVETHKSLRFYIYAVDPKTNDYDLYGVDAVRRRKETSDFVDAMWAMLVMRGYA